MLEKYINQRIYIFRRRYLICIFPLWVPVFPACFVGSDHRSTKQGPIWSSHKTKSRSQYITSHCPSITGFNVHTSSLKWFYLREELKNFHSNRKEVKTNSQNSNIYWRQGGKIHFKFSFIFFFSKNDEILQHFELRSCYRYCGGKGSQSTFILRK